MKKWTKVFAAALLVGACGVVVPATTAQAAGKSGDHRQDAGKGSQGDKSADHRKDGEHRKDGDKGGKSGEHRKDGEHRNDKSGTNGQ